MNPVKRPIALLAAAILLAIPSQSLGQRRQRVLKRTVVSEAVADAEEDAKTDVSAAKWLGCGCITSGCGVGAAYLMVPSPRSDRLMGKSPGYVRTYIKAYKSKARSVQTRNAMIGCAVSTAVIAGMVAGVVVTGASKSCDPGWSCGLAGAISDIKNCVNVADECLTEGLTSCAGDIKTCEGITQGCVSGIEGCSEGTKNCFGGTEDCLRLEGCGEGCEAPESCSEGCQESCSTSDGCGEGCSDANCGEGCSDTNCGEGCGEGCQGGEGCGEGCGGGGCEGGDCGGGDCGGGGGDCGGGGCEASGGSSR